MVVVRMQSSVLKCRPFEFLEAYEGVVRVHYLESIIDSLARKASDLVQASSPKLFLSVFEWSLFKEYRAWHGFIAQPRGSIFPIYPCRDEYSV